ncbi:MULTISPECIES: hypothetical protein [Aeromonas]|uniref:hypothetical protein n=1 Tax=Aeromonas TaxID=642 RepID=UPI001C226A7F|nr:MULTISPECIES: hypothetical protein [Aeromonas]MCR3940098.1 hypothetical protein [Aeromonas caviae]MCR3949074.1 hypothetical protein [Aeromonas caviae]QWZ55868.1 hypothetical protein I6L32_08855 [Aeromonas sp. FDAARGOS 1402]
MLINEIFDDEFTKSRRGLLIIFSIGFLHHLLGISFIDAKISIPGLPEVVASTPGNLTFAYIMFTLYATYRYVLNSGKQFSEVCRLSFSWGVGNFLARWVFSKILTDDNYIVIDEEMDASNNIVRIKSYEEQGFIAYIIGFKLDGFVLEHCWIKLSPTSSPQPKAIVKSLKDMWGFYENSDDLSNDERSAGYIQYSSHRIRSMKIRFTMYLIIAMSNFTCLFRKPRSFDYWTPVILNIALLVWLCYEKMIFISLFHISTS